MPKSAKPIVKQSAKAKRWTSDLPHEPGLQTITCDLFTIEHANQIYEAVNLAGQSVFLAAEGATCPHTALASELNEAVNDYKIAVDWQRVPTAVQLSKQAKTVARLSGALLDACLIDRKMRHGMGAGGLWAAAAMAGETSGSDAVKLALEGISKLKGWAEDMAARQARISIKGHKGGTKDKAMNELLKRLQSIYERHWGWTDQGFRSAGVSRPSGGGDAGGPWIRFLCKVTEHMGLESNPDAIAKAWRRMDK